MKNVTAPGHRRKKGVPLGELSPQATEGVGVQQKDI